MHNGRIATELTGAEKTEQNVLASFFENHLVAGVA
jgi:ribose transport system ATP-binding protein